MLRATLSFQLSKTATKKPTSTVSNFSKAFATSSVTLAQPSPFPSSSQVPSQPSIVPSPRPQVSIATPKEFLASISRPRRDLTSNSSVVSAVGENWEKMFSLNRDSLKQAGVGIKDRRYLLWALEKFRQGLDPKVYAIEPKPKKKVRGWGPRVQNGIRVSGRKRPGEK